MADVDLAVAPGELVATALSWVDARHLADRACRTLSPGELQRIALARALVRVQRGARVLLLDEPTARTSTRRPRRPWSPTSGGLRPDGWSCA